MRTDIVVGILGGLIQGWFLYPIIVFIFRESVTKFLAKISKNAAFTNIVGSGLAALGAGSFLALSVLLKDVVNVWAQFRMGWVVGFSIGALAYTLLMRPRK